MEELAAEEARRELKEKEFKEIADKQREAFEKRHDRLGTDRGDRAELRGYMEAQIEERRQQQVREERERARRMEELLRQQRER